VGKRVVILSGSLGLGHASMSQVLSSSLGELGWEARTLDSMALLGPVAGRVGEGVFRRLTAIPTLYDGLHFAHLRTASRLSVAMDALATRKLLPALRKQLSAEPADLVVSVFSTGAAAMARLVSRYPGVATVVFCTDATVHSGWVYPNVDLYLVTSAAAAATVRRYQPTAAIATIPPPVRPAFYAAPSRTQARGALGIPTEAPCVLLMGGGWGLGPMRGTAKALAHAGVHVLAVAGRNPRLERRLRTIAAEEALVHAFGYTDAIPELMAGSDLVVTTAGATTLGEARVVGRPLALLDVIPGHGRENIQHELELGHADVCSPEPDRLVPAVLAALSRAGLPGGSPVHQVLDRFPTALRAALHGIGVDVGRPAAQGTPRSAPAAMPENEVSRR
jgi:processive 1,2-diacylglycerol beta-glucosyltransferase